MSVASHEITATLIPMLVAAAVIGKPSRLHAKGGRPSFFAVALLSLATVGEVAAIAAISTGTTTAFTDCCASAALAAASLAALAALW